MKEIVNRLHEKRQIELAKEILESAGYKVSKHFKSLNESISRINQTEILQMFRQSSQDVLDSYTKTEDGAEVFVVECDNSNPTYIADLQSKLDELDSKGIGYDREDNGNGFYGRNYIFYKYEDFDESKNVEDLGDDIFEGREETTEFDAVFKTFTKEDYWGYAGAEKLPDGSGPYIAYTDAADIIISGEGRHNVLLDVESEDASYLRSFNKNNTEVKDIALDIYIGLNKGKNLATLAKHYDLDRF